MSCARERSRSGASSTPVLELRDQLQMLARARARSRSAPRRRAGAPDRAARQRSAPGPRARRRRAHPRARARAPHRTSRSASAWSFGACRRASRRCEPPRTRGRPTPRRPIRACTPAAASRSARRRPSAVRSLDTYSWTMCLALVGTRLAPDAVDEPLHGNRLADVEQQDGEDRALPDARRSETTLPSSVTSSGPRIRNSRSIPVRRISRGCPARQRGANVERPWIGSSAPLGSMSPWMQRSTLCTVGRTQGAPRGACG